MRWRTKPGLGVLALASVGFLNVVVIDGYDAARFNKAAEPTESELIRFVGGAYQSRVGGKGISARISLNCATGRRKGRKLSPSPPHCESLKLQRRWRRQTRRPRATIRGM